MSDLLRTSTRPTRNALPRGIGRTIARWMVSFAGYPLGGYAAILLVGQVDSFGRALAGGLVTGAILGAVQGWAMRPAGPRPLRWILATAVGLTAGVAAGAALADYQTDLGSLALQGAVCGALVGTTQVVVLLPRLGAASFLWPPFLSGVFAIGWAVTASAGIDVDQQFTIFGSSGAFVATLLTAVLPLVLYNRHTIEKRAS
jgi:hypothetical protein